MSIVNKPNEFVADTEANASEVNENFDTIYNDYNGNITAANLATDSVTTAKIAADAVTAAKIADGAIDAADKVVDGVLTSEKLDATIAVRAYRNAALSISTEADIVFDTETFDLGSDFNTTTGIFTAPVDGHYQVYCQIRLTNLGDGNTANLRLWGNGALVSLTTVVGASAGGDPTITAADIIPLTAGQEIKARMDISTSTALAVNSQNCYITISYIGK